MKDNQENCSECSQSTQSHKLHHARILKSLGYDDEDLSRPIIGIANAFSEIVPGHANLRQVAESVKKGIPPSRRQCRGIRCYRLLRWRDCGT